LTHTIAPVAVAMPAAFNASAILLIAEPPESSAKMRATVSAWPFGGLGQQEELCRQVEGVRSR
jgi:hypothetical protein